MTPEPSNEITAIVSADQTTAVRGRSRFVIWSCLVLVAVVIGALIFVTRTASSEELIAARKLVWQFCEESDPERRRELAERVTPLLTKIRERGDTESCGAAALQMALAFERGRTADATRLRSQVSLSSCASEDLATAAVIFAQAREFLLAEKFVDAAVKDSADVMTLRVAASAYYEMERGDDVFLVCQKWSQLDAANPEPFRRILQLQDDRGLIHLSADACRHLLKRSIDDRSDVQLKLVNLLIEMGSVAEARRQFAAAALDRSQDTRLASSATRDWLVTEARLSHAEGDIPQAQRLVQQVLAVDARHVDALLLQGQLLLSASEVAEASAVLELVVTERPLNGQAHYLLGQAYARGQQRDLADKQLALYQKLRHAAPRIRVLERRVARHPNDHESRRQLDVLYVELGLKAPTPRRP